MVGSAKGFAVHLMKKIKTVYLIKRSRQFIELKSETLPIYLILVIFSTFCTVIPANLKIFPKVFDVQFCSTRPPLECIKIIHIQDVVVF